MFKKCDNCELFLTICEKQGHLKDDPACPVYEPLEKRFFAAWILWVVLGGMALVLSFAFIYFIGMAWLR
jgi:hypothetical protein